MLSFYNSKKCKILFKLEVIFLIVSFIFHYLLVYNYIILLFKIFIKQTTHICVSSSFIVVHFNFYFTFEIDQFDEIRIQMT